MALELGVRYKAQVKIDVPTMARNKAPNRKGVLVLPPIDPPPSLARPLERAYLVVVRFWVAAIHRLLLPSYRSELAEDRLLRDAALSDDVGRLRGDLASVAGEVDRLLPQLDPEVREWATNLETYHRGKWARNLLQPTGVNLGTMMGFEEVGREVGAALGANASLIRSVNSELQTKIEGAILRGFTARTPARELAKELMKATGMARARAIRIASDQTLKLSSELDGARMMQAGINDWEWRHSGKLHPRLDHKARNGRRYNFTTNKPPEMPGQLPYCGCKKLALLLFGDEDQVKPPAPPAPPAPAPPAPAPRPRAPRIPRAPKPKPPAPAPAPAPAPPKRQFRSPINRAVTAATIQVRPRATVARGMIDARSAAAADPRYSTSQGDRWGDRSDDDFGYVNLGQMSPEAASTLAALIPELDDLADQIGIPRIRGIKGVGKAKANANMGHGILGVNPKSFDGYAAAVGGRTPIDRDAIDLERQGIAERYAALSAQARRPGITREEFDPLLAQLNAMRERDKVLYQTLLANPTVRTGPASTWKPGDPASKRPGSVDAYFTDGADRMRRVLFHEFGHHIHQQLAKRGPMRFQGDPPLELELTRLWGKMTWQRKELQPSTYATSDQFEWFAENFAAYAMGRTDLVDDELLELIERIFRGDFPG